MNEIEQDNTIEKRLKEQEFENDQPFQSKNKEAGLSCLKDLSAAKGRIKQEQSRAGNHESMPNKRLTMKVRKLQVFKNSKSIFDAAAGVDSWKQRKL